MKLKNSLLILTLITISSIHCFAEKSTIDIPFKNISIKVNYQYYKPNESYQSYSEIMDKQKKKFEDDQANKARIEKRKARQRYYYDTNPFAKESNQSKSEKEICSVDIQLVVKDPKTGADILLTKRRFNLPQGDMPISKYFQEHFMIQGKSAKIQYTAEVEYSSSREGEKPSIQSVEVNVLEASINGSDWPKKNSDKSLVSLL